MRHTVHVTWYNANQVSVTLYVDKGNGFVTDQMVTPAPVDLHKYIDAQFFGDRPHIRGKRIPVALIAKRMAANHWTIAETAYDFTLSEAEVLAALLYYEEHQDEIHQQELKEAALFNTMKRNGR